MGSTILVPLDGSALAEQALPYAEGLARVAGGKLLLLRVVSARAMTEHARLGAQQGVRHHPEAYLRRVAERLSEQGLVAETAVVLGEAAEEIAREAGRRSVDVVVMATAGRTGLSRWFLGSVAKGVLAQSPVPVLLARAQAAGRRRRPLGPRARVLVPLDGSAFAETVLPTAGHMARLLHAQVVLTQAVPMPDCVVSSNGKVLAYVDQQLAVAESAAQRYLNAVADRLMQAGWAERPRIDVRIGEPGDTIPEAASECDSSLIVMATHGRTGLPRLLRGSVAGSVLRQASLPLLLVGPHHATNAVHHARVA